MLTVADELAFDALEDETRKLCEKIIDTRIDAEADERVKIARLSWKDSNDELLEDAEQRCVRLGGAVQALEDQLKHHGIVPDRRFGAPPAQKVDASQFEAKPKKRGKKGGDDFVRPMGATPRD